MSAASPRSAPRLEIERLTLHVPPMSEADAQRLAELVGEALRQWPTAPSARSGAIGRVEARVDGGAAATAGPPPGTAGLAMGGAGVAGPALADPSISGGAGPERLARAIAEAVFAAALRESR